MKLLQVTTSLLAFPFVWLQAEERPNIWAIPIWDASEAKYERPTSTVWLQTVFALLSSIIVDVHVPPVRL